MKINKPFVFLLVFVVALLFTVPAFAQGSTCDPADPACVVVSEPSPPASTNPSLPDVAVLVAIVAFFKNRFKLEGNGLILTVVGVGAFLWFGPALSEKFPDAQAYIDGAVAFVKWILSAMGSASFIKETSKQVAGTSK